MSQNQFLSFEQYLLREQSNGFRSIYEQQSKQQNEVVYYAGLELEIEMEDDDVIGAYTHSDKRHRVNWLDYFDDHTQKILKDLATGDDPYGDVPKKKYTNLKKLDSVEVMFPNQDGEELTVYHTELNDDEEYEIDASCLDKNGLDFGQYLNDDGIEILYSLVDKKVK